MRFDIEGRRARLVARQHLAGTARDPVQAAADVVVLHATDPATVFLSVLARCTSASVEDVAKVMYDDRELVRMMAMRRTLFVVPADLVAVVHNAASLEIADRQRKRLLQQLTTIPTEPELPADADGWLRSVESSVERVLAERGSATAAQLSADEPRLRTALLPTSGKKWDVKRNITTYVLVLMAAEGRMVRAQPRGSWTSRAHTWEPASSWWPRGIPELPDARARLVEQYLRRFGPATVADVQWWTGWTLGATRKALAALETADVGCGLVMADDTEPDEPAAPTAALLPALDPTPMGWKERDWYLPEDSRPLFDRNGNIGPTIWWGGEVIGGWAVRPDGKIATSLLTDRGAAATRAVQEAADVLQPRLDGTPVVPSFPTPLEKQLRTA
ncbi:winged helix DNA-binding domain-containing protein [Saccharopolyspora indica]|uniref:winged helix DNA-binding domain-containing protein n=1 Tax=Saccharopolyspora indica TaxID=1229659 RepID=UPI0022EB35C1|nr:winged helix DNA-binding domain-containing protein [Saccharopolyspora indica]MDA3647862.1 winged helix DNA-binding domain-containing protein [Saccharopolyspora indica]